MPNHKFHVRTDRETDPARIVHKQKHVIVTSSYSCVGRLQCSTLATATRERDYMDMLQSHPYQTHVLAFLHESSVEPGNVREQQQLPLHVLLLRGLALFLQDGEQFLGVH